MTTRETRIGSGRWLMRSSRIAIVLSGFLLASCSPPPVKAVTTSTSTSTVPPIGGAPYDGKRFSNLYPFKLPTVGDLADWYWTWWRAGGSKPPPGGYEAIPVDRPDLAYLRANRRDTTATWIGHATVLLQLGGLNVMTDPQFSQSASPFSFLGPERKVRVPFTIAESPHIDVVLISHNHYDHLDGASVDALAHQPGGSPLFIVPLGVARWMRARGIDHVVECDWWQTDEIASPASKPGDRLRITFVPTQHWSSRSPGDRFETLWGGYVVERVKRAPTDVVDYRFFFAGDTGYAPLFRDVLHARFDHFDFAAIPIGAYEPNRYLRAQHVNPEEAVRIHRDLEVRQSMAIHWGTFVLTTEPFDQPPKDLAIALERAHLPPDQFVAFRHGEMRVLERAAQ
jgi:N-acyl-phosphatidylethanolamine-hydrolysing phospholipase D